MLRPVRTALRCVFLLIVFCLSTGCTYSVHPLLTDAELVDVFDLTGKWELELVGPNGEQKQKIPLELDHYEKGTYDLSGLEHLNGPQDSQANEDIPDLWTLKIGKIGDDHYAQFIPLDRPIEPPLFSGIPVHYFGRVELSEKEIKFHPFVDTDCMQLAKEKKLRHIQYEPSDQVHVTVFTMSTKELQQLVKEHGKKIFAEKSLSIKKVGPLEKDEDSK